MYDFEGLDYYEILGISRASSADEVKRAYRREIAKYHPDRYTGASAEQHEYAVLRSQRINEAYRTLSDFRARATYNRSQQGSMRPPPPAPVQPRDHQAELYDQARAHLDAGRPLQAIAALRQLQQINPLYRDSSELLAAAKAQVERRADQPEQQGRPGLPRRALIAGGAGGALVAAALLAWAIGRAPGTVAMTGVATASPASTETTRAQVPTAAPTAERTPEPTAAPTAEPTAEPTTAPTAVPTAEPTAVPTAVPTEALSAAPTATPVPTAAGRLVLSDGFDVRSWAQLGARGWSVGYEEGRYRVTADAGVGTIWSYRTGPRGDASYGVDAQIAGEAGLMLRFVDEGNYLTYTLDPGTGAFRVIQVRGGAETTLAEGASPAVQRGADSVNRLEARLRGERLELIANGESLAAVDLQGVGDSPRYGLVAIGGASASEALFDNLEIRTLGDS